jgi:hypothetical protein
MPAAHPIVLHKQELARQGQINQARIRAISGKMQAPAGRSRDTAEPALVGGCDRLAGPIGLAVCAEPVADPNQDDLVVVLPPRPDPGGKRGAGAIDGVAGATPACGTQPALASRPLANKAQTYPGREALSSSACPRAIAAVPPKTRMRPVPMACPMRSVASSGAKERSSHAAPSSFAAARRTPPRSSPGSLSAARSRSELG